VRVPYCPEGKKVGPDVLEEGCHDLLSCNGQFWVYQVNCMRPVLGHTTVVELGPPQLGLQPYGMLQSWFHVIYNLRVWGIGSGRCQAKPNGREDAWVEFIFLGGFSQGFLKGIE